MTSIPQRSSLLKNFIAPAVPYAAVGAGLLLLHSAWAALIGYHAGIVMIALLSKPAVPVRRLFVSNNHRISGLMAAAGAGAGLLLFALWPLLSVPVHIGSYIQSIGLTDQTWPYFLAYFMLVNPFMEEYFWRGYLGSEAKGFVANDFLFSGYHVIVLAGKVDTAWLLAVFLALALGAWLWRQSARLSGGLLASTLSHIAADVTVMLVIYRAVTG